MSEAPSARRGRFETHARDVAEVIEAEMKAMGEDAVAPIIVGHSFGGWWRNAWRRMTSSR